MRLYPPAAFITRAALREDRIGTAQDSRAAPSSASRPTSCTATAACGRSRRLRSRPVPAGKPRRDRPLRLPALRGRAAGLHRGGVLDAGGGDRAGPCRPGGAPRPGAEGTRSSPLLKVTLRPAGGLPMRMTLALLRERRPGLSVRSGRRFGRSVPDLGGGRLSRNAACAAVPGSVAATARRGRTAPRRRIGRREGRARARSARGLRFREQ